MKKILILLLILGIGTPLLALEEKPQFALGMGGMFAGYAITPSGFLGISSKIFDVKLGYSAAYQNPTIDSDSTLFLQGNLKHKLGSATFLTYGITLGLVAGQGISNGYAYGLFLGLQYALESNLLLDFHYYPLSGTSYTSAGVNVGTVNWGSSIDIAISYLL